MIEDPLWRDWWKRQTPVARASIAALVESTEKRLDAEKRRIAAEVLTRNALWTKDGTETVQ